MYNRSPLIPQNLCFFDDRADFPESLKPRSNHLCNLLIFNPNDRVLMIIGKKGYVISVHYRI